jgi:phosphoglycolate phosphatase
MKYENILWDWNGTLLNDAVASYECINILNNRRGKKLITFEQFQVSYRHPISEMYEHLGFNLNIENLFDLSLEWNKEFSLRKANSVTLNDDALECLTMFKEKNLTQAILSACYHEYLIKDLTFFKVNSYFKDVQGSLDKLATGKKSSAIELVKRLNIDLATTLLIGDSTHDAEIAKYLGIDCILVSCGQEDLGRLKLNGFPVFPTLSSILQFFLNS